MHRASAEVGKPWASSWAASSALHGGCWLTAGAERVVFVSLLRLGTLIVITTVWLLTSTVLRRSRGVKTARAVRRRVNANMRRYLLVGIITLAPMLIRDLFVFFKGGVLQVLKGEADGVDYWMNTEALKDHDRYFTPGLLYLDALLRPMQGFLNALVFVGNGNLPFFPRLVVRRAEDPRQELLYIYIFRFTI